MLKGFILLMLVMTSVSVAEVPYTVEDVAIHENFMALEAKIKTQANTMSSVDLSPVASVTMYEGTNYYVVSIDSDGGLVMTKTGTATIVPYLWLPGTSSNVYKFSVQGGILDLTLMSFGFNASNILFLATGTSDVWRLSGTGGYFNTTFIGTI